MPKTRSSSAKPSTLRGEASTPRSLLKVNGGDESKATKKARAQTSCVYAESEGRRIIVAKRRKVSNPNLVIAAKAAIGPPSDKKKDTKCLVVNDHDDPRRHGRHLDEGVAIAKTGSELVNLHDKQNPETSCDKKRLKAELDKKAKDLVACQQQLQKVHLENAKLQRLQSGPSSGERLFKDVLANLKEFLENQLQCSICNEVYISSVTIKCGHMFCDTCLQDWMLVRTNAKCPICRVDIVGPVSNKSLDEFISKFVDNFYPDKDKSSRSNLVKERLRNKSRRTQNLSETISQNGDAAAPALSLSITVPGYRLSSITLI